MLWLQPVWQRQTLRLWGAIKERPRRWLCRGNEANTPPITKIRPTLVHSGDREIQTVDNLTTNTPAEVYSEDMTEIETTINEAIEGGWNNNMFYMSECLDEISFGHKNNDSENNPCHYQNIHKILLDPKFWQAACKTWGQPNTYKYTMIYFMSLRADGLTTEEALTKLR